MKIDLASRTKLTSGRSAKSFHFRQGPNEVDHALGLIRVGQLVVGRQKVRYQPAIELLAKDIQHDFVPTAGSDHVDSGVGIGEDPQPGRLRAKTPACLIGMNDRTLAASKLLALIGGLQRPREAPESSKNAGRRDWQPKDLG